MNQPAESAGARPLRVLCVDDEPGVRAALRRELMDFEVEEAGSGAQARALMQNWSPDVVISDQRMPGEEGVDFLSWVADAHPRVLRILLTGYGDYQTSLKAINGGRVFALLEKPWSRDELQATVRAGVEVLAREGERERLAGEFQGEQEHEQLALFMPLLEGMAKLDVHKSGHARRVADLVQVFARFLKLSEARVQELRAAALAHELGELSLTEECRNTPQLRLQGAIQAEFQRHPERGAEVLRGTPALAAVARIVEAHHERFDGKGFPAGLAGEEIPVPARVLAVVDTYDSAMYGYLAPRRLSEAEARQYLQTQRGRLLDPRAVNAFLRCLQQRSRAPEPAGLPLEQLEPGMVLAEDLVSRGGILLVPADHRLTAALIERIGALAAQDGGRLRAVVKPARNR
ncbi:HD domain-containing phosphohydrolase [Alkalilimnicola sp. S0819]|uniref:HD domain-containing phosphohydrolase n=1 Tax=Alkalilimnicola sp. S0819 TaxID=2613922 RepID=UPI0012623ACF|nr:HD domain-containing phosphohydrolase [Alkalilimnicola sp. S0819]KAB7628179.1 response regulator [Alkalilimnicola sp. S0819]MPQ15066.1 response regulator [Alkalilimnicola sp. S0819]